MNELMTAIQNAIEVAKGARNDAGIGEQGRYLSLAVTELEKAEDWVRRAAGVGVKRDPGYPSDRQLDEAIANGRGLADRISGR